MSALSERFHAAHEREYTRRFDDVDIEIPNIRVRGVGLMPDFTTSEIEAGDTDSSAAAQQEAPAWFRVGGTIRQVATRYYDRSKLRAGNEIEGPAVVNQYDTTTVVPPEVTARIDRYGNIIIETGAAAPTGVSASSAGADAPR
ncbi:MAG: hypothetical protein ACE5EV_01520 [Gaiellales bacterium]